MQDMNSHRSCSVYNPDFSHWLDAVYRDTHASHIWSAGARYMSALSDDLFTALEEGSDKEQAVETAKDAGLPEGLIKTILQADAQGYDHLPGLSRLAREGQEDLFIAYAIFDKAFVEAALTGSDVRNQDEGSVRASEIWARLTHYIWQGCRIVLVEDSVEDIESARNVTTLEPGATVQDVRQSIIDEWGRGIQVIDIYCLRSSWDEPLLSSDITMRPDTEGKNENSIEGEKTDRSYG
tara:strand:- start:3624 stop:4334 length:711 start_codon:yes stop_codon:yes gene_type:complete